MTRFALPIAALALAACTNPLGVGEECSDSNYCEEGSSCLYTDGMMSRSVCMRDCDDATTRVCTNGEVCIPATLMGAPREQGVCFLGGTTAVGSACTDTFDCTVGSLCVSVGDAQNCYRACSTDDETSRCLSTETCEALVGMGTNGYCAPMP